MDNRLRARRILVIVGIGTFLVSSELLVFRSLNHFLDGFAYGMETLVQRATVIVVVVSAAPKLTPQRASRQPSPDSGQQVSFRVIRISNGMLDDKETWWALKRT